MRANVVKTVVNSVPHEGIDAVGVERTIPENPLRRKSDQKHWYIAIVNNKSEKLCRDKLEKRIASQPEGEKDYEVYIASQKEMCLLPSGKRKQERGNRTQKTYQKTFGVRYKLYSGRNLRYRTRRFRDKP